MQKVLITGANGFVGQHLTQVLKDYFIIGLTHQGSIQQKENQKFLEGNILDKIFLEDVIANNKPDHIIHLAAKAVTNQDDPEDALKVNFFGTLNLFLAILKEKKSSGYNPQVLYVSSAEVYGKTTDPQNITENSPFFPVNYYGVSKVATDRLAYQFTQGQELNMAIVRPFNHIGPGQLKGFFVPDVCSQIVEIENGQGANEIAVGNLESVRDFTDVRDIVEGYKLILEKGFKKGESYNLCSGKGIRMQDILEKLTSLSKKEIKIVQDPAKMRPSDMPFSVGDNTKVKADFNWNPKIPIDQSLEDALNYWRNKHG